MLSQLQFKVECFSQEEDKFVYLINYFRKVAFKNSLILDFLYLANTTNKNGEKKFICKKISNRIFTKVYYAKYNLII